MPNSKIKIKTISIIISLITGLFLGFSVLASETEGTIDSAYRYAWGENIGWVDFGAEAGEVLVTDSELSGWAFGENIGWISLNCSNDDSCAHVDYKITNDGEGNLLGYAWGENVGWIDFSPAGAGVWIDSDGNFNGYAFGENIGWIVFGCVTTDTCGVVDYGVKTDWQPLSARSEAQEADEDEESEERDIDISDVESSSTASSITVKWETDHKADSRVRYGTDKNLKHDKDKDKNEKKHRLTISNLEPETKYYFRVSSEDGDGNSDSSKIYSIFTKSVSENLASVPLSGPQSPPSDLDSQYEELKIEVGEKNEGEKEETKEQAEISEDSYIESGAGELESLQEKERTNFFAAIFSSVGRFFSAIGNSISGVASGAKNSLLAWQKSIQDKIATIGIGIGKKEREAKEDWRLYTARVMKKEDKKIISQVRFRLLDKKENPLIGVETKLFSDPKTAITDGKGIAAFKDVPAGEHTLAFNHGGKDFEKQVAIAEPLTEQGIVSAEVMDVKAAKESLALWMWIVILALVVAIGAAGYFAVKYYRLSKVISEK